MSPYPVLCGCTRMPSKQGKFCWEHLEAQQPCHLSEKLSENTRKALLSSQSSDYPRVSVKFCKIFYSHFYSQGSVFTVEALLESRKRRAGMEYLVKWAGFKETTWEPSKNIAVFIVKVLTFFFNYDVLVLN